MAGVVGSEILLLHSWIGYSPEDVEGQGVTRQSAGELGRVRGVVDRAGSAEP